jgi:hypothetical protein
MHGDKLKSVYCHWDGYLSYNGRILQEHYDSAKANRLVSLGSLSSLKEEIGEKHDFDALTDSCTFYGRDRGDSDVDFTVDQSYAEFLDKEYDCEYYYIMRDGVWYVGVAYEAEDNMVPGQLYVLSEQLTKVEAE